MELLLCIWGGLTPLKFGKLCLRSLSSAHEKWGRKQKCCIYNLVQCMHVIYIYIYTIFLFVVLILRIGISTPQL